jgi:hypothetical protein
VAERIAFYPSFQSQEHKTDLLCRFICNGEITIKSLKE